MKRLEFSVEIKASKEVVWNTLWDDATFRDWQSIIDEGTYMIGEMKEGNTVQFISSVGGYGVVSLIEKLLPNEFVSFKHVADTKENGEQVRDDEWSGGTESYSIKEHDGVTTLVVETDTPAELEDVINNSFPKALERVKILAEKQ